MRKTALALLVGAGLLTAATAASAQTFSDYGVTRVGQVCDDMGRCKEERSGRSYYNSYNYYAPGYETYTYGPSYYEPTYEPRYYRAPGPGVYVRTPGFSFGFGAW